MHLPRLLALDWSQSKGFVTKNSAARGASEKEAAEAWEKANAGSNWTLLAQKSGGREETSS
jgi:hypothetical protein